MITLHGAEVHVQFRTAAEGGRTESVSLSASKYCPHLQVSGGEYLGVVFTGGPAEPVPPGGNADATVAFVYEPNVNYEVLTVGTTFQVMEGAKVVAYGHVLRRM